MPYNQQIRKALTDEALFATTLVTIFVDTYGTEGFQWSPETIAMEIDEDFNIEFPRVNFDRLLTGINLITSDDFYKSLPDFINYCNVLSGDTYDPRTWNPASAVECAWGITESLMLSPPDEDDPFSEEIVSYIGHVLEEEGILTPPDVLKIAMRENKTQFVADEYSDDPIMFNAIFDFEQSKTEDINRAIRENLQALMRQLDALPLRSGTTKNVVNQALKNLGNDEEVDSIL